MQQILKLPSTLINSIHHHSRIYKNISHVLLRVHCIDAAVVARLRDVAANAVWVIQVSSRGGCNDRKRRDCTSEKLGFLASAGHGKEWPFQSACVLESRYALNVYPSLSIPVFSAFFPALTPACTKFSASHLHAEMRKSEHCGMQVKQKLLKSRCL